MKIIKKLSANISTAGSRTKFDTIDHTNINGFGYH